MSNRQKILTVLSTIIQPESKNPRHAMKNTEKAFDTFLKDVQKVPPEELAELVAYVTMAMNVLNEEGEIGLFGAVVLDDLKVIVHGHSCESCKGKDPFSDTFEDAEANACGDAGPQRIGTVIAAGSLEEVIETLTRVKKPLN
jgi:hypothetical protein